MRILILANNDIGLFKFRKELIEELISLDHDVYISLPRGNYIEDLEKIGCIFINTPIDRRGINPKTDFQLFLNYLKMMKKVSPDLIITYTIKPNIYGGIAARLFKRQYAVNITGLGTAFEKSKLLRGVVVSLYKYALKDSKVIFFENNGNRDELVALNVCEEKRTIVLKGAGVNLGTFSYEDYPCNTMMDFLFVGRVMKEKGVDELFEAMKRLQNANIPCFLDVVGPFEENYKDLLMKYEAEGWLKYHGYQEDVRPFIKKCDCFILPSYHEGMANTNLEAAASGRPLITSNIPGCREAIIENVSGLLCEPKNANSLYDCMINMIERKDRREMGLAGRKHMEEVFDKKRVVEETISCLFRKNEVFENNTGC